MLKFEYKFDSLPYNDVNAQRVKDVLNRGSVQNFSVDRHASGCVLAVAYLPSLIQFMSMEVAFRTAGLRS